jgi:sialic acid synthase SpsE
MSRCLVVPEIGVNHDGNMDKATDLIILAEACGCQVLKFQIYDVDKVFPDKQIMSRGRNWYKEVKKTQLSKHQVEGLVSFCERNGVEFFASVFDTERVKWLEEFGVRRYKIASRSIYDKELVEAICKTGKDIIVSLGMWKEKEFPKLITSGKVDYLWCKSEYPATILPYEIDMIDFNKYSGISDHSIGITNSLLAITRGAKIIEKHFTMTPDSTEGPDHVCSINYKQLLTLAQFAKYYRGDK